MKVNDRFCVISRKIKILCNSYEKYKSQRINLNQRYTLETKYAGSIQKS